MLSEDVVQQFVDIIWIVGQEIEFNEAKDEKHRSEEWILLSQYVKMLAVGF